MNYIVISPYYPDNFQPFSYKLRQHGVNVLGIGQEPYDQLNDELKATLTEYFRVDMAPSTALNPTMNTG